MDDDFAEYAAANWPRLMRSARLLGLTSEQAQDLVQETLLRCFVKWRRVTRAEHREAYVYRIMLNLYRQSLRRAWNNEVPTVTVPDPVRSSGDVDRASAASDTMERALGALPVAHRQVVVLRFYAELSVEQTAAALGVAAGTVKSRTARALKQLRTSPHTAPIDATPTDQGGSDE